MTRLESITCQSTNAADSVQQPQSSAFHSQNPQPSPTDDREHDVPTISAENTSSQEDQGMHVCGTMSPSALIAHHYRSLITDETMTPLLRNLISNKAPHVSGGDSASCLPPCRTICDISTESDVFHDQRKTLKRSKSSLELYSKLCDAPPVIIDEIRRYHEHAILQQYRRMPHNVVLDSLRPDVAPHIVITPALEQWDVQEVVENNRAGPQFFPYLTVPPFFGMTCRMHTYEEYISMFYQPTYQPYPPSQERYDETQYLESVDTWPDASEHMPQQSQPRRIRQFEVTSQDSHWAQFICDLTNILTTQARKLAAIEASSRAHVFRKRYDMPGFLESIQRPFEWTDAANIIFSDPAHRSPRSSILIESHAPYFAPHIIIHLAPEDHPAVLSDCHPTRQDTTLLPVPLRDELAGSLYAHRFDDEDDYDYLSDGLSEVDSFQPQTPSDLRRVGSGFFSDFTDDVEEDITSAHRGYKEYKISGLSAHHTFADDEEYDTSQPFQPYASRKPSMFFISSNDDAWDDDASLPDMETDEFFLSARPTTYLTADS